MRGQQHTSWYRLAHVKPLPQRSVRRQPDCGVLIRQCIPFAHSRVAAVELQVPARDGGEGRVSTAFGSSFGLAIPASDEDQLLAADDERLPIA
ncbi:hypothetical protein IWX77_002708 [Cryobacterium sp. CAN_C2]